MIAYAAVIDGLRWTVLFFLYMRAHNNSHSVIEMVKMQSGKTIKSVTWISINEFSLK